MEYDGGQDAVGSSPAVPVHQVACQRREQELADAGATENDRRDERSTTSEVETDDDDRRKVHHAESQTYSDQYTQGITVTSNER